RDLEAMCERGEFRTDLLYRLNGITLVIPPLAERRDEIEPLALRFLEQANQQNGRAIRGLSPEAMALLHRHTWPGNIRELRNAIERAVVIARGDIVTPDDLPDRVRNAPPNADAASRISDPGPLVQPAPPVEEESDDDASKTSAGSPSAEGAG